MKCETLLLQETFLFLSVFVVLVPLLVKEWMELVPHKSASCSSVNMYVSYVFCLFVTRGSPDPEVGWIYFLLLVGVSMSAESSESYCRSIAADIMFVLLVMVVLANQLSPLPTVKKAPKNIARQTKNLESFQFLEIFCMFLVDSYMFFVRSSDVVVCSWMFL